MEGVEPTHPYGYQILSLARLPIPPHRRVVISRHVYWPKYKKLLPERKHPIGVAMAEQGAPKNMQEPTTPLPAIPPWDCRASKLRPAIVLAEAGRGDWVLCQITSKSYGDPRAIQVDAADFARGSLRLTSYARPGKLFTANASLVAGMVGELQPGKFATVRDA